MTDTQTHSDHELLDQGLIPLIVGVTGHRDLVPGELAAIRARVRKLFLDIRKRFPDRPLHVLSPLAEGADQLVAEIAIELDWRLTVPMPMPKAHYVTDFTSADSRAAFERLLAQAHSVYQLPGISGVTVEDIVRPGDARNRQYAQLGVYLCAHCHILLALWDGKPSLEVGGTAQVVRFHHDDVMAGCGEDYQAIITSIAVQIAFALWDDFEHATFYQCYRPVFRNPDDNSTAFVGGFADCTAAPTP